MKTKRRKSNKRKTRKVKKRALNCNLLKKLTNIHAPSGEEDRILSFLVKYINTHKKKWKRQPKVLYGGKYRNNIILVFGRPRVALFSHIDSVGFMVTYDNKLTKIGGPKFKSGVKLTGYDHKGLVKAKAYTKSNKKRKNKKITYTSSHPIDVGTNLTYTPNWRETVSTVQNGSLDDRLGSFIALKLAETLENGVLVFTESEETGGGDIEFISNMLYKKYNIRRALISDIIPASKHVKLGKGAVVSYRDQNIPRRVFVKEVENIIKETGYKYQIEVADKGGTDAGGLISSPTPFDWCQVATPILNYHSPNEKANKLDIMETIKIYRALMRKL
jgi:putative aminopeptidase FrvX